VATAPASAAAAFSGSGCVSYLLKTMEKRVVANDFLRFPATIAKATVENDSVVLDADDVSSLTAPARGHARFIERTFRGIFFTPADLRFLDHAWANVRRMHDPYRRALALSALIRSCAKRQPRGVFTVAGDPQLGLIAFSHPRIDGLALWTKLRERGWFTSLTTEPRGLHLMLSPFHVQVTDAYLADLAWALEAAYLAADR